MSIADYAYIIADKHVIAEGTSAQLASPRSASYPILARTTADGPVHFHYPAPNYIRGAVQMLGNLISTFGRHAINFGRALGRAGFLLFGALIGKPQVRKHFPLFIKQLHMCSVQSLLIIMLSGFILSVWSLVYKVCALLISFSAETSLRQLVALSCFKLGGCDRTFIRRTRRLSINRQIGLMKATEQLSSLEMMAVDPLRRVIAPRFWAGIIAMPILSIIFIAIGIWGGSLVGVDWKAWMPVASGP